MLKIHTSKLLALMFVSVQKSEDIKFRIISMTRIRKNKDKNQKNSIRIEIPSFETL